MSDRSGVKFQSFNGRLRRPGCLSCVFTPEFPAVTVGWGFHPIFTPLPCKHSLLRKFRLRDAQAARRAESRAASVSLPRPPCPLPGPRPRPHAMPFRSLFLSLGKTRFKPERPHEAGAHLPPHSTPPALPSPSHSTFRSRSSSNIYSIFKLCHRTSSSESGSPSLSPLAPSQPPAL